MNSYTTMLGGIQIVEPVEQRAISIDAGYQPLLEREVIIKRLSLAAARNQRLRGQFIREIRTLASLRHHNIIQVYDAILDGEEPCVVLEQPGGASLQNWLDQQGPIALEEAVPIFRSIANATAYAHHCGVLIHDFTPSNILLAADGRAILGGLGQSGIEQQHATQAQLAYAAPERITGGTIDPRSDIYSLGVLLYHLISGRLPFESGITRIIAQKQSCQSLPLLDDPRFELPCSPALRQFLRRATARRPAIRYADIAALQADLDTVLDTGTTRLVLRTPLPALVQRNMVLRRLQRTGERRDEVPDTEPEGEEEQPLLERAFSDPLVGDTPQARAAVNHIAPRIQPAIIYPARQPEILPVSQPVAQPPESDAIHPLMPGRDRPELAAALAYTMIIPLKNGIEADPTPEEHMQMSLAVATPPGYVWLVVVIVLGILAAGIARTIG